MTTAPSPAAASDATAIPILEFGRAWMSDPAVQARAAELGLPPGFAFWVNGRAGVLGDVDAQQAAAGIGFMAPDKVAEIWDGRPAELSAQQAATEYAAVAATWGRQRLSEMATVRLERLIVLADTIIDAALPSCGALFAGWRQMERPVDRAGNATLALHVLREMRGGAHLMAVQTAGLSPQGAILSFTADQIRGGPAGAERFGWKAPHPEPDEAARAKAEVMTTVVCTPAFAALDDAERAELVDLVLEARAQLET